MSDGTSHVPLTALAPRSVPEAYVRAEVASHPLTSMCAFQNALTELNPEVGPNGDGGKTQALWRECEKSLVEHASGWSLDRLIAVRDFFWFGCEPGHPRSRQPRPFSMLYYLRRLAHVHLEARPGVTEIVRSTDANALDALTHYRWLTFALPEDLLLSAIREDPPPTRVNIEPPLLIRRLLDRGVAELHHHVGAGMDFPIMWVSALAALASPDLPSNALESPLLPFEKSEKLLRWLLTAAVSRRLLAEFLLRGTNGTAPTGPLPDFLEGLRGSPVWLPHRRRLLEQALRALASGEAEALPDFHGLRDLYGELHPAASDPGAPPPKNLEEIWRRCDPIAVRLALSTPNAGERWWMSQCLNYLERHERAGTADPLFDRLFWQTLRLRCLYYRTVVQRPMTAGLQWFVRFYGRLGPLRAPLRAARPEISYSVAGAGQPIAAIELRTSSDDTPAALAGELRDITASWKHVLRKTGGLGGGLESPELGVVLHFVKERDASMRWGTGTPPAFGQGTHAEPHPTASAEARRGGRYADFFTSQAVKARSITQLLREVPLTLWLLRGLDVASDELSVPTWVLVPLYRFVQREAAYTSARLAPGGPPGLRLTAHVGEDYRHLMEGLRRVYECLHYLLENGWGRLGHATALGMEPRSWAESVGSVMMPAEDRLWDLVFEWRLYGSYRVAQDVRADAPPGRPEQLLNRIHELSGHIFGECYEPQVLAELHHVLHRLLTPPEARVTAADSLDAFSRAHWMLDPERIRFYPRVARLLNLYREDEAVFRRGQELVDITLDASEVSALYAVQDALRRGVGMRGIVVEVNPSSNLLIGNLLDLRNHPILRLFPPESHPGAPPPVPIVVGSDDPITFSTHLLREYSLLHETALAAGYPERVVHDWLEGIRRTGLDARFTVAWRPNASQMADALLRAFDDYLLRPSELHPA